MVQQQDIDLHIQLLIDHANRDTMQTYPQIKNKT